MNNHIDHCCISDEEAHEIFENMQYEAKIQELEQKLKDMTASRNLWRDQCKEFYEDYKMLADKLDKVFPKREVRLWPTRNCLKRRKQYLKTV